MHGSRPVMAGHPAAAACIACRSPRGGHVWHHTGPRNPPQAAKEVDGEQDQVHEVAQADKGLVAQPEVGGLQGAGGGRRQEARGQCSRCAVWRPVFHAWVLSGQGGVVQGVCRRWPVGCRDSVAGEGQKQGSTSPPARRQPASHTSMSSAANTPLLSSCASRRKTRRKRNSLQVGGNRVGGRGVGSAVMGRQPWRQCKHCGRQAASAPAAPDDFKGYQRALWVEGGDCPVQYDQDDLHQPGHSGHQVDCERQLHGHGEAEAGVVLMVGRWVDGSSRPSAHGGQVLGWLEGTSCSSAWASKHRLAGMVDWQARGWQARGWQAWASKHGVGKHGPCQASSPTAGSCGPRGVRS